MTDAHNYARTNAARFREQLKELVRIPSVSTAPEHAEDVKRAAQWIADDMRRSGLKTVEIVPTARHPIVYGEWPGAGENAPTVLIYGHYDVQPAAMEDGWDSDPFEPVERDGRIYARGATDDKGQVMIHLKALESMLAEGRKPPVNLKYVIEGEEEISSPNLVNFVHDNRERLKCDICLISDTGIKALDQPSLVYGLRGLVTMDLKVSGPKRDLHSGTGGIVHNPAQALAEIIAKLHSEDGSVAVPGFYDDVATVSEEERAALAKSDISPEEWDDRIGAPQTWGEPGYTLGERIGIRPTLEINGIAGGYAGAGFKTVLPAKAIAKVSCRLVPNQRPAKIFEQVKAYVLSIAPPTVTVEVELEGMGDPSVLDIHEPAVQAAVRAYSALWDKEPILMRGGGSIPIVADFQRELGAPVVLLGFGLPDAGAHGPNESFHLEMYQKGVSTVIHYLDEVAGMGR